MSDHPQIKNPLTVIAIFAGIAEVSGTVVLPLLDAPRQDSFMWFVMLFPCLLVFLFFITLLCKHEVLYAPSDFRNDEAFLSARRRERERAAMEEKQRDDLAFAVASAEIDTETPSATAPPATTPLPAPSPTVTRAAHATYLLAEKLVLDKLEREFSTTLDRNSVLIDGNAVFAFDATAHNGSVLTAIEVKYLPTSRFSRELLKRTLLKIDRFFLALSTDAQKDFRVIFAVATDAPELEHSQMLQDILRLASTVSVPLDVRVYGLGALEAELAER